MAFYGLGKYDEAITECNKALEIDPNNADVLYNRACSKCKMEEIKECLDDLRLAIKLDKTYCNWARDDEDLASIKETEEFKLLLAIYQ